MSVDADLLIAGGGPIGLVTALHARRAGLSALIVEPRTAPIDKACGEGLMPPAVRALADLGVTPPGRPFRGITYGADALTATADFRHGSGLAVRRTELHDALSKAVVAAGVQVLTGRVTEVGQDEHGVTAAGIRARYLVAADGLHSPLRQLLGLARAVSAAPRWGLRAHYRCRPWSDRVEVWWSDHAEAYVTPLADECVGVALLTGERGSFAERLREFPALCARLPTEPIDSPRGAGPLRQHATNVVAGRVLLVGDAAGYVDALTGEGLSIGFACAAALVQRIAAGNPQDYRRDHARLTRRYRWLTTALVAAAQQPRLRRHIVPIAHRAPTLFAAAVNQLAK